MDEDDARAVRLRATPKGRRVLVQGRERRVAELVELLEGVSADELRTLGTAAEIMERVL